jgi:protein TonB
MLNKKVSFFSAKKFLSLVLAIVIAFALLFSMHLLVRMGQPDFDKSEAFIMPKFVHVLETQEVNTIKPPEKPPEILDKPEVVDQEIKPLSRLSKVDVNLTASVSINKANKIGLVPGDGEYLPIVKIAPVYPRRAAERCLEGYVIVSFTVSTSGSVENPRVVESSSSLFDTSAKKAASKFKYKPRMVDGKSTAVPDVTNKITYKMDGCK